MTSGSTVKEVVCEDCGHVYYYELARTADASSGSLFGLQDAAAKEKAQRGAQEKLAGLLRDDSEVVPCPECGRIQLGMVLNARRRKYRRLLAAGILLLVLGLGYLLAGMTLRDGKRVTEAQEEREKIMMMIAGGIAAMGALLCLARVILLRRLGRSEDEPWLIEAMEGAPPALLADAEPDEEGNYHLHPAPREDEIERRINDGSVTLCLLRVTLPEACCECLKPTTSTYRPIGILRDWGKFDRMPFCPGCARAQTVRSWMGVAMAALMLGSASFLVAMLIPEQPLSSRIIGAIVASILGTGLAIALVPAVLGEPFVMKSIDEERGLVRIRFRNPGYARLVRERVEELEAAGEDED